MNNDAYSPEVEARRWAESTLPDVKKNLAVLDPPATKLEIDRIIEERAELMRQILVHYAGGAKGPEPALDPVLMHNPVNLVKFRRAFAQPISGEPPTQA